MQQLGLLCRAMREVEGRWHHRTATINLTKQANQRIKRPTNKIPPTAQQQMPVDYTKVKKGVFFFNAFERLMINKRRGPFAHSTSRQTRTDARNTKHRLRQRTWPQRTHTHLIPRHGFLLRATVWGGAVLRQPSKSTDQQAFRTRCHIFQTNIQTILEDSSHHLRTFVSSTLCILPVCLLKASRTFICVMSWCDS